MTLGTDSPRAVGPTIDPEFSLIQARLSHEDDLVNQRVSWLVNSQSFLLTAYAITLNPAMPVPQCFSPVHQW